MSKLVLVRHGQSEWNAKGLWTGWNDPNLNEKGRKEAISAGEKLEDIQFDKAYTSDLKRAQQTLEEILKILKIKKIPTVKAPELKERNYGDLAGKNKWKIKEEYGDEQFMKWRRSWDSPLPNGESLKDVFHRVKPYFEKNMLPELKSGKNLIVAAHGNSLRALVKLIEDISDENISKLEFGLGEVYVYEFDKNGDMTFKEVRAVNENTGKI
jgi:2,3-bisphosphoglycerate-dependent phosphoglycerate mutase